jgi:RNA polymerase sigma-70 factor (ECF subfamily)
LTDREAIERFTVLYDQHCRQVYAYAVSRAGRQLAEEVVSEVFLITWRRLADVPVPALPWLLTVARNVVINQFRAAARQQSVEAELRAWASEPQAGSADVADQVTERITVLTAVHPNSTIPTTGGGTEAYVATGWTNQLGVPPRS